MDACHGPTGVTRHALSQLERLIRRPEIALSVITGRITHPDGLAYWASLEGQARRELPLRTRDILRWWRLKPWPPIEWWAGPLDWIYCPAEFFVPTRRARRAVTSHDVLQTLQFEPPRKRERLGRIFEAADLIFSVSHFNTDRLLEAFPVVPGPGGLCSQRRRRSVLRDGDRSRAGSRPRRSGAARADAVSALGGQFPDAQEPGPAHPCGGAAPGGGGRRSGDCADRHRCRRGSAALARGGRGCRPARFDPHARISPGT